MRSPPPDEWFPPTSRRNAAGETGPGGRPIRNRPTRMVAPAPTLRLPSRWPLQPVNRDNNKQKNTMHSSDMQLQGCAALRLLITSEESKLKAMSAGATDVLLAALRGNRNNAEVQEQARAIAHCPASPVPSYQLLCSSVATISAPEFRRVRDKKLRHFLLNGCSPKTTTPHNRRRAPCSLCSRSTP